MKPLTSFQLKSSVHYNTRPARETPVESQTIDIPLPEIIVPSLKLEPDDGCDRCGYQPYESELTGLTGSIYVAQAQVAVLLSSGGELKFCAHHYRENEAALATVAVQVIDNRDKINEKPASGSVHAGE